MPTPVFFISANGKDVTQNFRGANIQMTITDSEGYKADTLEIQLDDVDGSVYAPETGAILNPVGGYEGRLRDFGLFEVTGRSFNGYPQTITINAKSVGGKSLAKERKPQAFPIEEYPTYGDIFSHVAGQVGLQLEMAAELKSKANPYEAQAEEDALEFLTRIGGKINAAVTVKSQRLVVVVKGAGKTASGAPLDRVIVAPGINLLSYTVNDRDEPKHSKIEVTYYDRDRNERTVLEEETGMDGPTFLIRKPFQTESEAREAAKAKAKELVRQQADATFDIDGDPFVQAEAHAQVQGIRPHVDGLWRIKTVTHQFSATAPYKTSLICEVPSEG